eukprot:COSAG02_NODE_1655_length_11483_cov_3.754327_1_plen_139_part_00
MTLTYGGKQRLEYNYRSNFDWRGVMHKLTSAGGEAVAKRPTWAYRAEQSRRRAVVLLRCVRLALYSYTAAAGACLTQCHSTASKTIFEQLYATSTPQLLVLLLEFHCHDDQAPRLQSNLQSLPVRSNSKPTILRNVVR